LTYPPRIHHFLVPLPQRTQVFDAVKYLIGYAVLRLTNVLIEECLSADS